MDSGKKNLLLILLSVMTALTAVVAYILVPHISSIWQVALGVSTLSALVLIFSSRKNITEVLHRRSARQGLNVFFGCLVAFAIVVFVNLIAVEHDWKKDLTKNKLHTLSEQSVNIVKGLKSEVVIKAFVTPTQILEYDRVFDKYTYLSKLLRREYVDVDKEPLAVQQYAIKGPGSMIFESEGRVERLENVFGPDDPRIEEKITNAIIRVSKGGKRKLYFVSGHGERLTSQTDATGYSQAKELLEGSRYELANLTIIEKGEIPADAEILVVPGPTSEIFEKEYEALEKFLKRGGRVLWMVEPNSPPSVKAFLAKHGVNWEPGGVVVETNQLQQFARGNPLTPVVVNYDRSHPITQKADQLSLYVVVAPVTKLEKLPAGVEVASLMSTSQASYQGAFKGNKLEVGDKKNMKKGPFSIALAVTGKADSVTSPAASEEKKPEAKTPEDTKEAKYRMVVVGDSDFASNQVREFGLNTHLFQNMLSWLVEEEDLISIRPEPTDSSEWDITGNRMTIITLASVFGAPPLFFLLGILVFFSRRKK